MKMIGVVKFFQNTVGWGFITADDVDYFVYHKDIVGDGFKKLSARQQVSFTPKVGAKGMVAIDVIAKYRYK